MKTFYTEPKASEREYQQLEKLGKKLGVPVPGCFLEMEVVMPDGEVVHRHKQRSHSWTRNMYNFLFTNIASKDMSDTTFGAGLLSLQSDQPYVMHFTGLMYIAASNGYYLAPSDLDDVNGENIGIRSGAGIDTTGILVGGGTDAEDFEGIALSSKILNGNTSGKLAYQNHNLPVTTYDTPSKTMSVLHVRFMNNNSGADIDVNETALMYGIVLVYPSVVMHVLFARDLLGATVTVPNTGQLKVSYTINMIYPH